MRRFSGMVLGCVLVVAAAGCYHATINTGLTPSTTVIDQPMAAGWAYGLVAPKPVDAMSRCPSGVAKVETEHSFVNSLIGGITFGIFTPMHIRVTCAQARADAGSRTINVAANATPAAINAAIDFAVEVASATGATVFVTY
jgi:hypothetical protein